MLLSLTQIDAFDTYHQQAQTILMTVEQNVYRKNKDTDIPRLKFCFCVEDKILSAVTDLLEDYPYRKIALIGNIKHKQALSKQEFLSGDVKAAMVYGADLLFVSKSDFSDIEKYIPSDFVAIFVDKNTISAYANRGHYSSFNVSVFNDHIQNIDEFKGKLTKEIREKTWANEIGWRLCRIQELFLLSQLEATGDSQRERYEQQIADRIPAFAKEDITRAISLLQEIALPSIIQLLQQGISKKNIVTNDRETTLNSGFDKSTLAPRHSLVKYQHRMHSDISAFSAKYIYEGKALHIISDTNAISVLKQVFLKEFWENGQMEFIESKGKCAEITFDIPPIYGNEAFLLDESFGADTPVNTLLREADGYVFTGKVRGETSGKKIYIKKPTLNKDFLVTTNNPDVFLVSEVPCSMALSMNNSYITNFDIGDYNTLPEKGMGRLFAIKCGSLTLGKTHRFFRHKKLEELIGKNVLDLNGNQLVVSGHAEENRRVETDLRMAREYERMDPETLEARLEKKDSNIFSQTKLAGVTTFNIELSIQKRRMTKKAEIYSVYDGIGQDIAQKIREMELACIKAKKQELIKDIKSISAKVSTINDYIKTVNNINRLVDKINGNEDVDSSLSEVVGNRDKQKAMIAHLKAKEVDMDMPANGTLYQDRDKYEYVLSSDDMLDSAIAEMKSAGIENSNIAYITE